MIGNDFQLDGDRRALRLGVERHLHLQLLLAQRLIGAQKDVAMAFPVGSRQQPPVGGVFGEVEIETVPLILVEPEIQPVTRRRLDPDSRRPVSAALSERQRAVAQPGPGAPSGYGNLFGPQRGSQNRQHGNQQNQSSHRNSLSVCGNSVAVTQVDVVIGDAAEGRERTHGKRVQHLVGLRAAVELERVDAVAVPRRRIPLRSSGPVAAEPIITVLVVFIVSHIGAFAVESIHQQQLLARGLDGTDLGRREVGMVGAQKSVHRIERIISPPGGRKSHVAADGGAAFGSGKIGLIGDGGAEEKAAGDISSIGMSDPGIPLIRRQGHFVRPHQQKSPGCISRFGSREPVAAVARILRKPQPELFQVVDAVRTAGPFPRLVQRGQQHRCQDGDDGDDDKKFNQGKMLLHEPVLLFWLMDIAVNHEIGSEQLPHDRDRFPAAALIGDILHRLCRHLRERHIDEHHILPPCPAFDAVETEDRQLRQPAVAAGDECVIEQVAAGDEEGVGVLGVEKTLHLVDRLDHLLGEPADQLVSSGRFAGGPVSAGPGGVGVVAPHVAAEQPDPPPPEAEQEFDRAARFQLVIHRRVSNMRQVGHAVEEHHRLAGSRQRIELLPDRERFLAGQLNEPVDAFAVPGDEILARSENQSRAAIVAGVSGSAVNEVRVGIPGADSGDADVEHPRRRRSARRLADDRADARLTHDQPLRLEQTQRLAHRKAADIVLAAELVLRRKRASRCKIPFANLPRQRSRHLFENRNLRIHSHAPYLYVLLVRH